jgi:arsenite-transporting ATPase
MDELFSLLQIKRHHESGEFDVVVVDCAPTGETLRLLSFPEVANWWLEKVFPWDRRLVAAAKPIARMLDVEVPDADVVADVQRLAGNLIAMNRILRDTERATLRLVMNADRMVIKEAQRTFTYLNLYGYLTDAVIVNRVFPAELADGYFGAWRDRQSERLEEARERFAPVPLLTARYFDEEVIGARMLDRLADELFAGVDAGPGSVMHSELTQRVTSVDGRTTMRLRVPFTERDEVSLKKVGAELIISVGHQKRTIILPGSLARQRPTAAKLEDGALEVSFDGRTPAVR